MLWNYYEIHSFRFALATDSDVLKSKITSLFPVLHAGQGNCNSLVNWSIREKNDPKSKKTFFSLYENNNRITSTEDIGDALHKLEWAVILGILKNLNNFIQLHASGIRINGEALLIIGEPDSGKSTLALNMLFEDFRCYSDEIVLISPKDLTVWSFPRNFHITKDTMRLFPEFIFEDSDDKTIYVSDKICFDPCKIRTDWVADHSIPKCILFPNYHPNNENELLPIGETETLQRCVEQAINLVDFGESGLEKLIKLIQNCSCYLFNCSTLNDASKKLVHLMDHNF